MTKYQLVSPTLGLKDEITRDEYAALPVNHRQRYKRKVEGELNKNSNHFRPMYAEMGINLDKLGCIMLDVDGSNVPKLIADEDLYFTQNPDRFWIKGFVAGHTPHVTLLYGIVDAGERVTKQNVDTVLEGWKIDEVNIDHIGFFDSPFEDDPYYCIIAHVDVTPNLLEGHKRLSFLPHINTYPEYKAHITLAYVRKDERLRDRVIQAYTEHFFDGTGLKVTGLNYGKMLQ